MPLSNIKPITVLIRYANEFGDQEARYAGYLTGSRSAMYFYPDGTLNFSFAEETEAPDVYLELSGIYLGNINDADEFLESESIVEKLASILHNMTAHDFMTKVIVHIRDGFDFEGLIIPKLINETNYGSGINGNPRHIGD
jgi:hypothetical protein